MEKPTLRETIFAGSIVAMLSAGSLAVASSQRETGPVVDSTTTTEQVTTTTSEYDGVQAKCADELAQFPEGFAVAYLNPDGSCSVAIP